VKRFSDKMRIKRQTAETRRFVQSNRNAPARNEVLFDACE